MSYMATSYCFILGTDRGVSRKVFVTFCPFDVILCSSSLTRFALDAGCSLLVLLL